MFLGYKLAKNNRIDNLSVSKQKFYLDDLVSLLQAKYVDNLHKDSLLKDGIEGLIKNLDPHTIYIPADKIDRANNELEGNYVGIGIEFYVYQDTVYISSVIDGGPAQKGNISLGDQIIAVNDKVIAGKGYPNDSVMNQIRGKMNSDVRLQLRRLDGTKHSVVIERGNVPLKSVPAFFMLDHKIGYIKISLFSETTYAEFQQALKQLCDHGLQKLIIDVRDNPGGYMDAVAKIADEVLSGHHTIVTTKGKYKEDSLMADKKGLFEQGSISVLINENSASASEILAGALQDLDRGLIIGRRSFGKGLVQEQFSLPNQAALRITTARYYLPSGRCIQKEYNHGREDYHLDIYHRIANGSLLKSDSAKHPMEVFYTTKKRKVYGGEGIRPDLFIALDTTSYSDQDVWFDAHATERFAHQYYFFHKSQFNAYTSVEALKQHFQTSDAIRNAWSQFVQQNSNLGKLSSQANQFLLLDIQAQFAHLLFGNNGKYSVLAKEDSFIQAACKQ